MEAETFAAGTSGRQTAPAQHPKRKGGLQRATEQFSLEQPNSINVESHQLADVEKDAKGVSTKLRHETMLEDWEDYCDYMNIPEDERYRDTILYENVAHFLHFRVRVDFFCTSNDLIFSHNSS